MHQEGHGLATHVSAVADLQEHGVGLHRTFSNRSTPTATSQTMACVIQQLNPCPIHRDPVKVSPTIDCVQGQAYRLGRIDEIRRKQPVVPHTMACVDRPKDSTDHGLVTHV